MLQMWWLLRYREVKGLAQGHTAENSQRSLGTFLGQHGPNSWSPTTELHPSLGSSRSYTINLATSISILETLPLSLEMTSCKAKHAKYFLSFGLYYSAFSSQETPCVSLWFVYGNLDLALGVPSRRQLHVESGALAMRLVSFKRVGRGAHAKENLWEAQALAMASVDPGFPPSPGELGKPLLNPHFFLATRSFFLTLPIPPPLFHPLPPPLFP